MAKQCQYNGCNEATFACNARYCAEHRRIVKLENLREYKERRRAREAGEYYEPASRVEFVDLRGWRGLAAAVVAIAAMDARANDELAREWLTTTGREWVELLGVDSRLVEGVI